MIGTYGLLWASVRRVSTRDVRIAILEYGCNCSPTWSRKVVSCQHLVDLFYFLICFFYILPFPLILLSQYSSCHVPPFLSLCFLFLFHPLLDLLHPEEKTHRTFSDEYSMLRRETPIGPSASRKADSGVVHMYGLKG